MWSKEGMRPRNVPSTPNRVYKDYGWEGWGHWLGTGNAQRGTEQFLPFAEALALARSLGLAGQKAWKVWCKEGVRPRNVPADPYRTYTDHGWQGWGHWLGTGSQRPRATKFLEFGDALRVARALRLNSKNEWKAWCRNGARPVNVPSNPDQVYVHDGWIGWGHWLGTGNQFMKNFLPFSEALLVARAAGLASVKEWEAWCRDGLRPPNMPSAPGRTYKLDGWRGWRHWLGTEPGAAAPRQAAAAGQQRGSRKRKR